MTDRYLTPVLEEAERIAEHHDQVAQSTDHPEHEFLRYAVFRLLEKGGWYTGRSATGNWITGLTTHAGHDAAVDLLDRIEENARFHIDSLTADALTTGKALFRQHEPLSFVNACIIAYMQTEGLGYLYAFDDDSAIAEDVDRLDTATDPYDPN